MGNSSNTLRLSSVVLFALVAALSQQARGSISLVPFTPTDDEIKVFTTEVKRDENVNSNSQRGHDVFLRNQDAFAGPSFNLDWGASGTAYDWLLSYDGDEATFTFAGRTLQLDVVPDLRWDAINIIARSTDSGRFTFAESTVTVDEVNGASLASPEVFRAELVEFNEHFRVTSTGESFTSIGGTFAFDFEEKPAASGSPNSQYSFIVKGLNSGIVPEPGSGLVWLLLTGIAARCRRGAGRSGAIRPAVAFGQQATNNGENAPLAGRVLAVIAVVLTVGVSAEAASTTYVLNNHPNGNVEPPRYGLRLDDLSGPGEFTFSFDPADGADMKLVYDDVLGTIEISGTVYGGKDAGQTYDPAFVGLWGVAFTYATNVVEVGNGLIVTPEDPSNSGTIEFVSGTGWSPGETFQLTDFRGGNANSFLLLSDGHRLNGDNSTIVGRGWVNHDGDGDLATHNYASDWLFVATEVPLINPGGGIVPEPTAVVVWAGVLLVGRLRLTRAL